MSVNDYCYFLSKILKYCFNVIRREIMEIKNLNSNMINAYKNVASTKVSKEKSESSSRSAEKFDKVEFDFGSSMSAAKANIAASVDAEANTSRIEQLQMAYRGDACPISAQDVAAAIVE